MTEEHLEILRQHCEGSDEDIQEASDAAENAGYGDDGTSNNPGELIAFINGYLYHKAESDFQKTIK
jgi:hypothetical protein